MGEWMGKWVRIGKSRKREEKVRGECGRERRRIGQGRREGRGGGKRKGGEAREKRSLCSPAPKATGEVEPVAFRLGE